MIASGRRSLASLRPVSALNAVRTPYPSSLSIRANVCVTPSSSSTMRIAASRAFVNVSTSSAILPESVKWLRTIRHTSNGIRGIST
jgi:hypothetical protein